MAAVDLFSIVVVEATPVQYSLTTLLDLANDCLQKIFLYYRFHSLCYPVPRITIFKGSVS